jgi:(1->4)-alpha-D-glucan 1-alpha-D-glucosylmutase
VSEIDDLPPEDILRRADEGLPKLWIIKRTLRLKRTHPELFGPEGDYLPLETRGSKADHVIAFARGQGVITVTPRLVMSVGNDWEDTTLTLLPGQWRNVLAQEDITVNECPVGELFHRFPLALLARTEM